GLGLRISQHIDTAFDLQRLFSNRHELMAMPFGSEAHRAALFSVLDPDGSLGLSSEPSAADLRGVEEGALMRFASAGALSQRERMDLGVMDPAAPLLLFHENWKQGGARHLEL